MDHYCHIHVESGRAYIGLTKLTMMKRWNRHVYDATKRHRSYHFANAIRKYGKEAFSHTILEVCKDLEVANLAEKCWIELLDTRNPGKGFNLSVGGDGPPPGPFRNPWKNPNYKWHDPEYRRLHGEKMKSIVNDPVIRAKIAASMKVVQSTPEYRQTLSDRARGRTEPPAVRQAISRSLSASLRTVEGHVSCGTHGLVPFIECFRAKSRVGQILYRCKHCILGRKKRKSAAMREARRDSHGHLWVRVNARSWKCSDCGSNAHSETEAPPTFTPPDLWLQCREILIKTVQDS